MASLERERHTSEMAHAKEMLAEALAAKDAALQEALDAAKKSASEQVSLTHP